MSNFHRSSFEASSSVTTTYQKLHLNASPSLSNSINENEHSCGSLQEKRQIETSSSKCSQGNQLMYDFIAFDEDEEDNMFQSNFEELDTCKGNLDHEISRPGSTDADSDSDYESHFEAIDELSEILSGSNEDKPDSPVMHSSPFVRPDNPVCYDRQFYIPRCSAPGPFVGWINPEINTEQVHTRFSSLPCPSFASNQSRGPYINMRIPTRVEVDFSCGVLSNRPSSLPN